MKDFDNNQPDKNGSKRGNKDEYELLALILEENPYIKTMVLEAVRKHIKSSSESVFDYASSKQKSQIKGKNS